MAELTDTERDILDFERAWWKYAGAKDRAIRDRFDITATRYYQVLHALVETPEAHRADPITCRRILDLREQRRRQRSAARLSA